MRILFNYTDIIYKMKETERRIFRLTIEFYYAFRAFFDKYRVDGRTVFVHHLLNIHL